MFLLSQIQVDLRPGVSQPFTKGLEEHPGQKRILFGDWQYFVAMWGRRTGKTITAAALVTLVLSFPKTRVWIVAPTYELTDRVFDYVYQWLVVNKLFDKILGSGSIVKASKTKDLRYIETKWGSFVRGKSAEAPDSLIGDQLDLIVFDEAARCSEKIFPELLEPTLLDRNGRALFISTPRGKNWFFQYFQRRLEKETIVKGWDGSQFKSADNPFISEEEIEKRRAETPPDVFRREYEASPEEFSGMIYPMYRDYYVEEGGHLFNPRKYQCPVGTDYLAIDIGWRHPTAALWARADREDNIWIVQEYQETGLSHAEHAKNIVSLSGAFDLYMSWISPDAKRKHPIRKRPEDAVSPMDVYKENGLFVRPAVDDLDAGVDVVRQYLFATLQESSAHPKLFISEDCVELRSALQQYIYDPGAIARKRDIDPPERPRKYKDDMVDALRYLLATRPRFIPRFQREDVDEFDPSYRYGHPRREAPNKRKQTFPGAPVILGS